MKKFFIKKKVTNSINYGFTFDQSLQRSKAVSSQPLKKKMVFLVKNCFLLISLCSVCGILLIPVTYSLVTPLKSKFKTHLMSPSDTSTSQQQSTNSLGNQVLTIPIISSNETSSSSSAAATTNQQLITINGTNFRESDFMVISGSNNASQVSLVSSIFQNSRKPKKNQSRIFFIPIRSLVPISFNGTMIIFDSRSNSSAMTPSTASAANNGNVTFVLIEEDTNSTVTASLTANGLNSTEFVAVSPIESTQLNKIPPPTTTTTTTSTSTTTSEQLTTTTLAPSNIQTFNDRIFFSPIPQVINFPVVNLTPIVVNSSINQLKIETTTLTPTTTSTTKINGDEKRSIDSSKTNSNGIPVGRLSKDQVTSLLSQFSLNSSEQILNSSSIECEKQLDQTDYCMRTVLLVNTQSKSPTTLSELDDIYCKNLTGILKCLGGYARCLHRVPRIIYNFVYLHIKKTLDQVCRNNNFRADIIYHSRCFSTEKELNVVKRIVDQGTLTALYVLKYIPTNNIIGWGCCGYQKMFTDGVKQINDICIQKTGNLTGDFAMGFLKSAASDLIDIGCFKYSSIDLCNQNLPEAMITFNQLTSGNVPEQKYSPVIPLIEIARRLSSTID